MNIISNYHQKVDVTDSHIEADYRKALDRLLAGDYVSMRAFQAKYYANPVAMSMASDAYDQKAEHDQRVSFENYKRDHGGYPPGEGA